MTIVASSGAQCGRRRLVAGLGLAGLLMTLAGCAAGDMAGSVATPVCERGGRGPSRRACGYDADHRRRAPIRAARPLGDEINEQC